MSYSYFSTHWCNLQWSDWLPLKTTCSDVCGTPKIAGLYRIRPCGGNILAYIGQTGRNLRERLRALKYAYDDQMPFNDPHTAAQSLWVLRIEDKMDFECSTASTPHLSKQHRHGLEDMLLWKHRCESSKSTLCNYGRFHPHYFRSRNRSFNKRGGKLPPGELNPASGPSTKPLHLSGKPNDDNWMQLKWSKLSLLDTINISNIPTTNGLYKILNKETGELIYVGQTQDLRKRLRDHSRDHYSKPLSIFSYHVLPSNYIEFQRHELESDLLGAYYYEYKVPPAFQYRSQAE